MTLILYILCGLQSYAEPQPSEDQTTNTISGTVINSVTHEPIGRALVYTPDEGAATFTDDHGNFELTVSAVAQPPARRRASQDSDSAASQEARLS